MEQVGPRAATGLLPALMEFALSDARDDISELLFYRSRIQVDTLFRPGVGALSASERFDWARQRLPAAGAHAEAPGQIAGLHSAAESLSSRP